MLKLSKLFISNYNCYILLLQVQPLIFVLRSLKQSMKVGVLNQFYLVDCPLWLQLDNGWPQLSHSQINSQGKRCFVITWHVSTTQSNTEQHQGGYQLQRLLSAKKISNSENIGNCISKDKSDRRNQVMRWQVRVGQFQCFEVNPVFPIISDLVRLSQFGINAQMYSSGQIRISICVCI